jgi:hypothetical protein
MDSNKCSENLGTDGFYMNSQYNPCFEGDTDMFYSADKDSNLFFQCKMSFNRSATTREIDVLSLH